MRVTLVFSGCHPRGGVERVVWEAAHFLRRSHDVTVVTGEANPLPPDVSVRIVPYRRGGPLAPVHFRHQARKALSAVSSDRVVSFGANCPSGDVLVVQSVHKAWVQRGGSVRFGRALVPGAARWLLPRHLVFLGLENRWIEAARSRQFIAVSEGVAEDLVGLYGVELTRIAVVPNGFSPEQCSPERRRMLRPDWRARLSLAESDVALLMVANEWHRKGLGTVLEAMSLCANPELKLILVGRQEPSSYEGQVRRLGLTGRVAWYGPTDDVALYHAAADLFVLPTTYEAFGTVIVEALASGLPVVTSRLAGAAAAVLHGANGLLLEHPRDAAELASQITSALRPGVLAAWSAAAPSSVTNYSWPAVMRRLEDIVIGVPT